MLAVDETAVICDLAQTYGVLFYRKLPVTLVAALVAGLGEESRIKQKLAGAKAPANTLILAGILDRLTTLCWRQTVDGQAGQNPPKSLFLSIVGEAPEKQNQGFDTPDEFRAAWAEITGA